MVVNKEYLRKFKDRNTLRFRWVNRHLNRFDDGRPGDLILGYAKRKGILLSTNPRRRPRSEKLRY